MANEPKILIIAGYASMRAGLHALLADAPGLAVLGAVEGVGDSLARLLPGMAPDALLLDTTGEGDGDYAGDLLGFLAEVENAPAVVILSDAPDQDLPRLAEAALPGWAYLLREADGPQIVEAVRSAAAGLVVLDRALALRLVDFPEPEETGLAPSNTRSSVTSQFPGENLTPREVEVLQLMAEGLPNKIIASRLKISLHTAKFHVAQILGKLDADSRTEAVTIGARRGYVTL